MTSDEPGLRRGGLPPRTSVVVAAAVAGAAQLVVVPASFLVLDNLYGPLGDHPLLGRTAAVGCVLLAGAGLFALARSLARRSRAALVLAVGLLCVGGWSVAPRKVDVSESFVPVPNERWSCTGWSFEHYPPGTSDGNATRYCMGLERRIADG
jgi:hypothetical protein